MYLNKYTDYLTYERNLSKNTVYNYSLDLNQFLSYVKKDIHEIETEDILAFIKYLRAEKNYSVTTTNRKLSSIKSFFNYLVRERIIPTSPAAQVECGKTEYRLPVVFSNDDVNNFINSIDNERDKLLVELLYATAARRSEICRLKMSDVDFERGLIRLKGKGNKERLVPVYPELLSKIKSLCSNNQWLFPSRKGGHITTRAVNHIINKYRDKAGLNHATPHKFRHSCLSALFEGGADLKVIQDIAGHSSPATTSNIYTRISVERNKAEYLKFHPKAKATG